jgi:hypothetical protein
VTKFLLNHSSLGFLAMTRNGHLLRCVWVLALLYVPVSGAPARAGKVKAWHHHSPAHFEKAHFHHAVVSSEGALRLSRQIKPLAGVDASHVWDVVEDRDGNLFVATGDEGKLYKVTPDGKVQVAYAGEESEILCLALAPDGKLYAGTGPSGQVLCLAPDGTSRVVYRSGEGYVWSLAIDAAGQCLYAGTGPKGRIHKVTPDGKGQVFYATRQEHVLCLALGPTGLLYAGTDKGGLVYRIDAKGKGFVLFSAPQAEVRSLLVTADAVYAGTSSPGTRRRGGATASAGGSRTGPGVGSVPAVPTSAPKARPERVAEEGKSGSVSGSSAAEASKGSPAPTAPPPAVGENSLYRIAADGSVRELFREKTLVLSQLRQNGRLLLGTGMEGQLFEVDEATRERTEIARLDHGQIHCLLRRRDGSVILGAGDPGRLYSLRDGYAPRGTVVSEVLDARLISKWGALRWRATTPAGTAVTVAVRTGNVAEPDDTWSDWSAEQTDPQQAIVEAPAARFLQYRVTLTTDSTHATPAVQGLTLRYRTTNQAPEVTEVEVPDLDAGSLDNPKKLKLRWTATDANEDELTYSLYVRKDGWKSWVQLEDGLEKKEYEWDTTTAPSGVYHLKVVASDRKDNPAEEALTGERVSGPFVVAHTPPSVTVKVTDVENGQAVVEATATDPLVRLTAASFAVNGKKWVNVFPTDGLFDSKTETFRFKTEALKPGTYVLVLRVRDAAGNVGSGDVVFTVHAKATLDRREPGS